MWLSESLITSNYLTYPTVYIIMMVTDVLAPDKDQAISMQHAGFGGDCESNGSYFAACVVVQPLNKPWSLNKLEVFFKTLDKSISWSWTTKAISRDQLIQLISRSTIIMKSSNRVIRFHQFEFVVYGLWVGWFIYDGKWWQKFILGAKIYP